MTLRSFLVSRWPRPWRSRTGRDGPKSASSTNERQVQLLKSAVSALQKRLGEMETELYVARSDQQRSAALADALREELARLHQSAN